jgi:hypothetical protein
MKMSYGDYATLLVEKYLRMLSGMRGHLSSTTDVTKIPHLKIIKVPGKI